MIFRRRIDTGTGTVRGITGTVKVIMETDTGEEGIIMERETR